MGRMEIITGRERRRRWSDEKKLSILAEVSQPGISGASVARRHDILPQQLYTWRRRFRQDEAVEENAISFLPVELVRTDAAKPEKVTRSDRTNGRRHIEIRCRNGRVLKVAWGMAADTLRDLIRLVEEA